MPCVLIFSPFPYPARGHPVRHVRCIKTARRSIAYYLSYSRVVLELLPCPLQLLILPLSGVSKAASKTSNYVDAYILQSTLLCVGMQYVYSLV